MKKIVVALIALSLSFTVSAQKRKKGSDFTVEQKTELALKKMTLDLDLSDRQANKIRPLLAEKISDRSEHRKNKKVKKEDRKRLSSDERFKREMARLDKMIAFKANMKDILNDDQYERFEKIAAHKKHKMKRRGKHRRMKHDRSEMDFDRG
ncbi:hypothetical protein [Tenacibaculum sp. 190524A05c]|uniref:hypothetical protein n=1 Tax=Tenacibaculum platacis TaxID=3137852 RepID=UPI0031FB57E5